MEVIRYRPLVDRQCAKENPFRERTNQSTTKPKLVNLQETSNQQAYIVQVLSIE